MCESCLIGAYVWKRYYQLFIQSRILRLHSSFLLEKKKAPEQVTDLFSKR